MLVTNVFSVLKYFVVPCPMSLPMSLPMSSLDLATRLKMDSFATVNHYHL